LEHEGKWYCKTHHWPTQKAKIDAQHDAWEKKFAAEKAARTKAEARAALAERALQLSKEVGDAYLHFAPGCRDTVRPNSYQMEQFGDIAAELEALEVQE
jgi:hypothetical protein